MPFMPLYIEQIGVKSVSQATFYAGLALSLTSLASGLIAPVWGRFADRYGRKPMMVRAGSVMVLTMGGLAFVPNVYWLLALRVLNGLFSGFIPNATALIASQVPKDKSGYALGTLSTGMVAGNLIGPSLGGLIAQIFGMKNVFLITGSILLLATLMTIFFLHEDFTPVPKGEMLSTKQILAQVANKQILFGLFVTTFILQIATQSIEPFVTLYIRYLSPSMPNLMFISGLIVSAVGFSAMLSSSYLGRIGDRLGNHRMILIGLVISFLIYFPMTFVTSAWQLGVLRFFLGFGTGALMPSINSLLSKITPRAGISRIFAFNQMAANLGVVAGPMLGSAVAGLISFRAAILVTSFFVLINIGWSLINFRKYLHKRSIIEN